jgi:DNA-binding CsgD family transcriptional regulator
VATREATTDDPPDGGLTAPGRRPTLAATAPPGLPTAGNGGGEWRRGRASVQLDGDGAMPAGPPHAAGADWFARLKPHGALFAVDATQQITRWGASSAPLLGDAEQTVGRRCYEVLASLDARNAARCRPNCPVMAAARRGRPLPDFEVWLPGGNGDRSARVSVLLSTGDDGTTEVLHLVHEPSGVSRRSDPAPAPEAAPQSAPAAPAGMRVMLDVLAADAAPDAPPRGAPAPAPALTERHRQVLAALAVGEPVDAIARRLGLSTVTVRNHVQAAMERLGAHSRLEAVLTAVAQGLL